MAGRFEIFRHSTEGYRFRLRARNGEVILASESSAKYANCVDCVEAVQKSVKNPSCFEIVRSANGKHYFVLSADRQIIGRSELYESADACADGVASAVKNAPAAKIVDLAL